MLHVTMINGFNRIVNGRNGEDILICILVDFYVNFKWVFLFRFQKILLTNIKFTIKFHKDSRDVQPGVGGGPAHPSQQVEVNVKLW